MKLTLTWLQEFIDLNVAEPRLLAEKLTGAGIQVASATQLGNIPDSVVVARIITRDQHPNADRLSLCKVEDGTQTYAIVCGATNMKAGDKVALAKVGSKLPNDLTISKSKIRGETSEGMLCSSKELQLGGDADGIIILPADAPLGKPLVEHLNLKDAAFEIEITPNRGDCLSVVGIARELAAIGCGTLKLEAKQAALLKSAQQVTLKEAAKVQVDDVARCPRYMAQRLDLPATPLPKTPDWIVRRLEAAGERSISLIVDITNYVMLEWGQPLHAFDFDKVGHGEIRVRTAKPGEKLLALDDKEYALNENDLLIADRDKGLCIAGVMGGSASGVTESTRRLLLESAHFEPGTVRKTSKRLGLISESSHRFERYVDPEITPIALARAAALILEFVPGAKAAAPVDKQSGKREATPIVFRPERFARLIGYPLEIESAQRRLTALGCKLKGKGSEPWSCVPPSWRADLKEEADLIEEIARLEGYDRIPKTVPGGAPDRMLERSQDQLGPKLRGYLTALGFMEVKNLSFISSAEAAAVGMQGIRLANPLSEELALLRPSLIPSLLRNFRHNYNHFRHLKALRCFEIGTTFNGTAEKVEEATKLTLIAWQGDEPTWRGKQPAVDFFWLKGIVEGLLQIGGGLKAAYALDSDNSLPFMHPGAKSKLLLDNQPVGSLGCVHPQLLPDDCREPVVLLELDLKRLYRESGTVSSYTPVVLQPVVQRDMALLLDETIEAGSLQSAIRQSTKPLLTDVRVIDHYKGGTIPQGKKSLAFRLSFQAKDRTLKDEEVDRLFTAAVDSLKQKHGAQLR